MRSDLKYSRLNVVLVAVGSGGRLHRVALADDADVALEVALGPAARVVRVREQRPLVVELVVCQRERDRADLGYNWWWSLKGG